MKTYYGRLKKDPPNARRIYKKAKGVSNCLIFLIKNRDYLSLIIQNQLLFNLC